MDPDAYIRIDPLPSNDGFQMMDSFAQSVANEQKKEILQDSLRKSKPFRQFRNALDATALEDEWYDFKDAYLRVYVRDLMEVE